MKYKISIIIPVYNVEKYIEKCLDSIIKQSYKNLEIIVVNDGSKDNSIELVSKFNDKRIKIINKENGGLSSARNCGLEAVTGNYVMFVDSDDWLDKDCIEKCINELKKKEYDLVFFPYIREYNSGSYRRMTFEKEIEFNNKEEVMNCIVRKLIGPINKELKEPQMMESNNTAWAKLYRTSIIKNIKFTDLKKSATEDLIFNIKACCNVKLAKYITNTFYHYNKTNISSITKTETFDLLNRWKYLFNEIEIEMKKNKLVSSEYIKAFNNRKIINLFGICLKVSMMDCNTIKKCRIINYILKDEMFKKLYKDFQFEYLDLKWKLFYKFCQYRLSILILIMIFFAKKMRKSS